MKKQVLAVDLGASGGRVMLGICENQSLELLELHRFANKPLTGEGNHETVCWDVPTLLAEIKTGIRQAAQYGQIDSISVDTWGVDFGLLDENGRLLELPVHYRDQRTRGMREEACCHLSPERFYEITGNQLMEINTVFQLYYLTRYRPELLRKTKKMLLMPDLFHYLLCGVMVSEHSIASTTQMLDAAAKTWSGEVLDTLGIPGDILPPVIPGGTRLAVISGALQKELGIGPATVIASAGHDTQCAMAAVPASTDHFIFISCGTWSLCGTELSEPLITAGSMRHNLTNEGGAYGRYSFMKNIAGTWLIQECQRTWAAEGRSCHYSELDRLAEQAPAAVCLINPDDPVFAPAGDMPERIRRYAQETGQAQPAEKGAVIRCIYESLALAYRKAIAEISACTGIEYKVIHMVGGGSQSELLCAMTADACNCEVVAGPVEATVLGNIGIQLTTLGTIKDLQELRKIIAASTHLKRYQPRDPGDWDNRYQFAQQYLYKENQI